MAERKTVMGVSMGFMYRPQAPGCHDPPLGGAMRQLQGSVHLSLKKAEPIDLLRLMVSKD